MSTRAWEKSKADTAPSHPQASDVSPHAHSTPSPTPNHESKAVPRRPSPAPDHAAARPSSGVGGPADARSQPCPPSSSTPDASRVNGNVPDTLSNNGRVVQTRRVISPLPRQRHITTRAPQSAVCSIPSSKSTVARDPPGHERSPSRAANSPFSTPAATLTPASTSVPANAAGATSPSVPAAAPSGTISSHNKDTSSTSPSTSTQGSSSPAPQRAASGSTASTAAQAAAPKATTQTSKPVSPPNAPTSQQQAALVLSQSGMSTTGRATVGPVPRSTTASPERLAPTSQRSTLSPSSPSTRPASPSSADHSASSSTQPASTADASDQASTATAAGDDADIETERRIGGTPIIPLGKPGGEASELNGWHEVIHLDGSLYYWHQDLRIVTTDNIKESGRPSAIIKHAADLKAELDQAGAKSKGIVRGQEDVVVCGVDGKPGSEPEALLLDHRRGWYIERVWCTATDSAGVQSRTPEVAYEQRTEQYWRMLERFPMHLTSLPTEVEAEFFGALVFGSSERILDWRETAFPFSDHQAERLIQVYMDLKDAAESKYPVVPAMGWHIARTMVRIEASRTKHKHGTHESKLYRDGAIDAPGWQVKVLDLLVVLLLLGMQRMYRLRLQSARVKGVVNADALRELFEHFLDEWADSNLLATVFIGANIGFLAVSGIDSLQQTALLVSTVFSTMSVVAGVHHTWQHRTKVDASPEEASHYLTHASRLGREVDLAVMACFLALPVSSLLWAIIAFAVALGAFCIQNTDIQGKILLSVSLGLLGLLCMATLFFFWHIWRGPRREELSEEDAGEIISRGWKAAFKRQGREIRMIFGKSHKKNGLESV
ncbi:uncharacterized protein FIBRA_01575 [Fibroporia radiculosa]|uniref:WW domain-containing protein n=1 Tax=Fibroporia radiculosa TaxID=599839 RepID=J4HTJ9_9APHY|nr:uncharacterized protein FIBRA_01575 [Fibroporia radiculosa]CCL99557.1 predicted protein [Fibroporia radiculosa]